MFFWNPLAFLNIQRMLAIWSLVPLPFLKPAWTSASSSGICQHIWKTQQWLQDWKRSVFIPIPKKGNAKECSNYCTIALISHASKVMLKILQARLQQYVDQEIPDVQAGFRKGRGTRDQIANIYQINLFWRKNWNESMLTDSFFSYGKTMFLKS